MSQAPALERRQIDSRTILGRAVVWPLMACGIVVIFVPLLLTLYLSAFDEKLIIFPPRGYTVSWYAAIAPNFGDAIVISLELALGSVAGSLVLGVPAGIALWRHRTAATRVISTLLLAPLTVPGMTLLTNVVVPRRYRPV